MALGFGCRQPPPALPLTELLEDTGLQRDGEFGLGCTSWGLRQSQRSQAGGDRSGLEGYRSTSWVQRWMRSTR